MPAPLSPEQCLILADALPDTPQTVISTSQLRRGLAQAYVIGKAAAWETAVIEDLSQPGEPMAFGANPEQMADILAEIPDWFCVNVAPDMAPRLGPLLAERMDCSIRYYGDLYHTLSQPTPRLDNSAVRRLSRDDLPLLQAAPPAIRGHDPRQMVAEMSAAGAIIDGQIVAIAQNYALSARYGDISVATLPEYRRRGLAAAAASLIARWLQENGRIPIWSCGEDNKPSLRVAQKLGFRPVSQRTYIILDKECKIEL